MSQGKYVIMGDATIVMIFQYDQFIKNFWREMILFKAAIPVGGKIEKMQCPFHTNILVILFEFCFQIILFITPMMFIVVIGVSIEKIFRINHFSKEWFCMKISLI